MIYISSDTNVWIDFMKIEKLELPFKLPCVYLMYKESIEDELLSPADFKSKLKGYGLVAAELSIEEFNLAESYGANYLKLSKYDRIALAIAKYRHITLLTGDGALRKAAQHEKVPVIGTIAILDHLYGLKLITIDEYKKCLRDLQKVNGKETRLPKEELEKRLRILEKR